MKILWMTDIHLRHSVLSITEKLFKFVLKTAEEYSIENIVISGDVNDTKAIIRAECLNQLRNFCKEFIEESPNKKIYFLVGNHDMISAKNMKFGHSLESLNDIENVFVIDKPSIDDFMSSKIKFIPYTEDNKTLLKELKNEEKADYAFCHNGIFGAQMNSKGMKDEFSISVDKYSNFKKVFVGHYHNFQQFQNVTYLGSPFSHSFSESNVKKYIGLIDLDTGNVTRVSPGLRAHIDYDVHAKDILGFNEIKGIKKINFYHNEDDLVRIFLTGTKEDNMKAREFLPKSDNVKIIAKNLDRTEERIKISPEESKQGILNKYVEKVNVGTLDKVRLLEIGKSII